MNKTARQRGFTVIKNLTGHGVGHEEPEYIFNFFSRWDDELLKNGMVLASVPFISIFEEEMYQSNDGWRFLTNESVVAQFEHTINEGRPDYYDIARGPTEVKTMDSDRHREWRNVR